ncbi:hypothetical protein F4677DRAFT_83469 [Hypoxylon crocopeplum]|nr:hypothetical protein F4677DRAFT_83469 [Hypoxylon crocopeplum]
MGLPIQTIRFLEQLESHNILLIEWQNALLIRLGYPLVPVGDLFFLVPDDQLGIAAKLAADIGYHAADRETLPPKYPSEESSCSIRYIIRNPSEDPYVLNSATRLVLLPSSWAGISHHEAIRLTAPENSLPCTVYTVPVSVACAAFVRIISREKGGSALRRATIHELCGVITYRYFDMSYEGDYREIVPDDQPLSEKEVLEIENAIKELEGWEMKEGEEWIRSQLIQVITGKISYENLPSRQ